jgi:predicted metalloprotease
MRWSTIGPCLCIFLGLQYTLAAPAASRQLSLAESTDLIARWLVSWGDNISNKLKTIPSPQILFGIAGSNVYGGCIDQAGIAIIPGSFFCPKTNTIVLEVSQLEDLRRRFGDGAVVYAVAHEFGHWLQMVVNQKRVMPNYELQADCIAGVVLKNAAKSISLSSTDLRKL